MGPSLKSPEGHTAWEIANAVWGELYQIRRLLEDEGDTSEPRWLSIVGDAYAGGGLTTVGSLRVPPGMRWTALAVSGSSGSNGADVVELFRNVADDSGFITRMVAQAGRWSMVNLPDNLQLQENTLLIARVTILAAADGRFPTVNVATREVHVTPMPVHTQEAGEDIMDRGDYLTQNHPGLDREAEVEYQ